MRELVSHFMLGKRGLNKWDWISHDADVATFRVCESDIAGLVSVLLL
jgi:hypothetical protein